MKKGELIFLIVVLMIFNISNVFAETLNDYPIFNTQYQCYDLDNGDNVNVRGRMIIKSVPSIFNKLNLFKNNKEDVRIYEEICQGNSVQEFFCNSKLVENINDVENSYEIKNCLYGCEFGECLPKSKNLIDKKYNIIYFNCEAIDLKAGARYYSKFNEKFESGGCMSESELRFKAEEFCLKYYRSPFPKFYSNYNSFFPVNILSSKIKFEETYSGSCDNCVVQSCNDLGYECGSVKSCSSTLNCGSCGNGKVCENGVCIGDVCDSIVCDSGKTCVDGECVSTNPLPISCSNDDDCGDMFKAQFFQSNENFDSLIYPVCIEGKCVNKVLYKSLDEDNKFKTGKCSDKTCVAYWCGEYKCGNLNDIKIPLSTEGCLKGFDENIIPPECVCSDGDCVIKASNSQNKESCIEGDRFVYGIKQNIFGNFIEFKNENKCSGSYSYTYSCEGVKSIETKVKCDNGCENDRCKEVKECVPKTCSEMKNVECGWQDNGCGAVISCGVCDLHEFCDSGECIEKEGCQKENIITKLVYYTQSPFYFDKLSKKIEIKQDKCKLNLKSGKYESTEYYCDGLHIKSVTTECNGECEGAVCKKTDLVCVPKTCKDEGLECGYMGDGCGGTNYCGGCGNGECKNGVCVVPEKQKECNKVGGITSGYYTPFLVGSLAGYKNTYNREDKCSGGSSGKQNLIVCSCDETKGMGFVCKSTKCENGCDPNTLSCIGSTTCSGSVVCSNGESCINGKCVSDCSKFTNSGDCFKNGCEIVWKETPYFQAQKEMIGCKEKRCSEIKDSSECFERKDCESVWTFSGMNWIKCREKDLTCVPKTCSSNDCGLVDDGCGHKINCAGCNSGKLCVSGTCKTSSCSANNGVCSDASGVYSPLCIGPNYKSLEGIYKYECDENNVQCRPVPYVCKGSYGKDVCFTIPGNGFYQSPKDKCLVSDEKYTCEDSDGGYDIYSKSTCTDNLGVHSEVCYDSDYVAERLCGSPSGIEGCKEVKVKCPNGCVNGVCI